MRNRKITVQFYACILAVGLLHAQDKSTLAGRWRSVQTSRGGIGAMYEFRADGTFSFSPGAIVEMPWRVEADQLILPPATTTGPEQKSRLTWDGNDVLQMDGRPWHRQGSRPDAANRLVGEWLGSQQMEGRTVETRFIFDSSGNCLMLLPFLTQRGSYSVRGANLTATLNGAKALEGTFEIANGVFSIHRTNGKVTTLKRY